MRTNKPWNQRVTSRRPEGSRERRRVLILCEDSKSSRYYFEAFPVDEKRVEVKVVGTGMNTSSLVEEAIRMKANKNVLYNEVWCVFDRDDFPLENYNRAFQVASRNGIKVAWANEAFELWYLLHFDYRDSAISRASYKAKLSENGLEYDKGDTTIYESISSRREVAIKNARKLEKYWNECGKSFPERENPSTNIHKLVELLIDLAELSVPNP